MSIRRPRRLIPDDFRKHASADGATRKNLRNRYGTSREAIARWLDEAGITIAVGTRGRHIVRSNKPDRYLIAPVDRPSRDTSRAGDAAEHLRRLGPVYRCDVKGRPNPRADYWMRGSTVLSDADIIERAERMGWSPDAWRAIPAVTPPHATGPGGGAAVHARASAALGAL